MKLPLVALCPRLHDLMWERYVVGERIAETYVSEVFKGLERTTGRWVALKVNRNGSHERLLVELQRLRHARVLVPDAVFRHEGKVVEVYPYLTWPTLERARLAAADIGKVMTQVLEGLAHLHRNGIIHHDVKENNVFFDPVGLEARVFDLSHACRPYRLQQGMPRRCWEPPEYETGNCEIDLSFDVYGAGQLLQYLTHELGKGFAIVPRQGVPARWLGIIERASADRAARYRDCGEMLDAFVSARQS